MDMHKEQGLNVIRNVQQDEELNLLDINSKK